MHCPLKFANRLFDCVQLAVVVSTNFYISKSLSVSFGFRDNLISPTKTMKSWYQTLNGIVSDCTTTSKHFKTTNHAWINFLFYLFKMSSTEAFRWKCWHFTCGWGSVNGVPLNKGNPHFQYLNFQSLWTVCTLSVVHNP